MGTPSQTHERINYLYQIAQQCLAAEPVNLTLCKYYIHTLKIVVKRQVCRIHPDIKRRLCKRCCVLLYPGITAKVRNRSKPQKHTVVTCLECGKLKRYLHKKDHCLWINKPEALV